MFMTIDIPHLMALATARSLSDPLLGISIFVYALWHLSDCSGAHLALDAMSHLPGCFSDVRESWGSMI